jgi:hypothetical protein
MILNILEGVFLSKSIKLKNLIELLIYRLLYLKNN